VVVLGAGGMAMIMAMVMLVVMVVMMPMIMRVIMAGHRQNIVAVVMVMVMAAIRPMDVAGLAVGWIGVAVRAMVMAVIMMLAVIMATMVVSAALGPERSGHLGDRAALPADHLGKNMVFLDIERVRRDLGGRMTVANVPGHPHQPEHALRSHFEQRFGSGLHLHEAAVIQVQGVAFVERRGPLEVQQDLETALGLQDGASTLAVLMVEHDGGRNLIGLDGWLADDGGGTQHDGSLQSSL